MKVIELIEKNCNCVISEVNVDEKNSTSILYKKDITAPYSITINNKNSVINIKYDTKDSECNKCLKFAWEILSCFIDERKNGNFKESFLIKEDSSAESLEKMISQTLHTIVSSELFDKAAIMFFNPRKEELRGIKIVSSSPYPKEVSDKFIDSRIKIQKNAFDNFPESAVIFEGELRNIFQNFEEIQLKNMPIVSPIMTGKKIYGILAVCSNDTYSIKHIHACSSTAGFIAATISANIVYKEYALSLLSEKNLAGQIKNNERILSLGSYAASIVHEIKNPLISIGGFAKRLMNAINDPNLQKMANIISSESERLERLAEDILSYTKKHEPNKSSINLKEELDNIKILFDVRSNATNIQLNTDAPVDVTVDADKNHLRQVLVNLVANSMNAIGSDGEINIIYENRGDFHIIKVSDTGGGIPEENISKLFKPFFTTSPKGTGLGLSISKKIMTNHGGDITVKNNEKGAEFTLLLPK